MIPSLHLWPDAIAWIVHPAAGFSLALFASVLYSRQGKQPLPILRAAAIIAVLAVLGAAWVAHPAAGMVLGAFGMRAFRGRADDRRAVAALLGCAVLFMVLGAAWLIYPLSVMTVVWVFVLLMSGAARTSAPLAAEEVARERGLPEHAGGLPVIPVKPDRAALTVPARSEAPRRAVHEQAASADPFTALQLDDRLPGDIRAQLAALDLRTAEALTHLGALGQGSSEGAYVARTIRDEYAPASVRAYLNLPRTRADVTPIEDGKTGRDLLREQLDILLGAVQDILDFTLEAGGKDVLTNQRFLQDKFGKGRKELDV